MPASGGNWNPTFSPQMPWGCNFTWTTSHLIWAKVSCPQKGGGGWQYPIVEMVFNSIFQPRASLVAQMVRNLPVTWKTRVWSLGLEDPLEKGMATHFSSLARRIPWTEEPGGLQYMGLQSRTRLSNHHFHCNQRHGLLATAAVTTTWLTMHVSSH